MAVRHHDKASSLPLQTFWYQSAQTEKGALVMRQQSFLLQFYNVKIIVKNKDIANSEQ